LAIFHKAGRSIVEIVSSAYFLGMLALVEEIGYPVGLVYWIFLEKGIFER
jgi:hypothetical protein